MMGRKKVNNFSLKRKYSQSFLLGLNFKFLLFIHSFQHPTFSWSNIDFMILCTSFNAFSRIDHQLMNAPSDFSSIVHTHILLFNGCARKIMFRTSVIKRG